MIFGSTISPYVAHLFRRMAPEIYQKPMLKLGDVAKIVSLEDVAPKDIQNWTLRGFLKPVQLAPRRPKLYSVKDTVQASVIGHLYKENSFSVANTISLTVANRGLEIVAEKKTSYDFFARSIQNDYGLYYYTVKGNTVTGIFLSKYELTDIIIGKNKTPEVSGIECRILEADKIIFDIQVTIVEILDFALF